MLLSFMGWLTATLLAVAAAYLAKLQLRPKRSTVSYVVAYVPFADGHPFKSHVLKELDDATAERLTESGHSHLFLYQICIEFRSFADIEWNLNAPAIEIKLHTGRHLAVGHFESLSHVGNGQVQVLIKTDDPICLEIRLNKIPSGSALLIFGVAEGTGPLQINCPIPDAILRPVDWHEYQVPTLYTDSESLQSRWDNGPSSHHHRVWTTLVTVALLLALISSQLGSKPLDILQTAYATIWSKIAGVVAWSWSNALFIIIAALVLLVAIQGARWLLKYTKQLLAQRPDSRLMTGMLEGPVVGSWDAIAQQQHPKSRISAPSARLESNPWSGFYFNWNTQSHHIDDVESTSVDPELVRMLGSVRLDSTSRKDPLPTPTGGNSDHEPLAPKISWWRRLQAR